MPSGRRPSFTAIAEPTVASTAKIVSSLILLNWKDEGGTFGALGKNVNKFIFQIPL